MSHQEGSWTSKVTLKGLDPGIMFDRYLGDNTSKVANYEKMNKTLEGQVYIPAANVISFLSAQNTRSAARALYDTRKYKDKASALLGATMIHQPALLLTRSNEPIMWRGEFDEGPDTGPSGIWLHKAVARLAKGIPNPKERPVISAPWETSFEVTLFKNDQVKPDEFRWLVETGMMLIGLGTYRGVFGKAEVSWG